MHVNLRKYAKDIRAALARERYNHHPDGIVLFHDALVLSGEFIHDNACGRWEASKNLVVTEGAVALFNIMFGSVAKIATWYLAPFGGATAPAATWTSANFTANSTENVSTTEGFSESTRQAVTFANATTLDQIDNYSSRANFTIVTATSVIFTGMGLLSVATRGGTTGTLYSATKFTVATTLNNAAVWAVGYRAVGTPS